MTADQLLAARALVDRASRGPWHYETTWNNAGSALADLDIPGSCIGARIEMLDDDAAFIAASRTLVPALLDLVESLTKERDKALALLAERTTERDEMARVVAMFETDETGRCAAMRPVVEAAKAWREGDRRFVAGSDEMRLLETDLADHVDAYLASSKPKEMP